MLTQVVCGKDPHLLGVSKYLCTISISFALINALLNLKGVASLPLFVFHLQQKWRIEFYGVCIFFATPYKI